MNLGDGLLFELENGKPKLIVLSHGLEENPVKLSIKPRVATVLSPRQPSCVDNVHVESSARQHPGRPRDVTIKAAGGASSFTQSITADGGKSTTPTTSKTRENHTAGGTIKAAPKAKSERLKHKPLRGNGKTGQLENSIGFQHGAKVGLKDTLGCMDAGQKDSMVCLTNEQLQQILNTIQPRNAQHPPEDHRTHGKESDSKFGSLMNDGDVEEMKEGGGGGQEESKRGEGTTITPYNRSPGCLFSWLEERESESRAAMDAKKAQWRRELNEQVALKQQQSSAAGKLQTEEDMESVLSVQSSLSHREQPAAIRSSLRLGEVTPMEEVLSVERREEQRRRWLEELDRQREETIERRRQEKLLQSQTEDHELWATHFDSLQRHPPVQSAAQSAPLAAPLAAPPCGSERGEWEPSSSLSLAWDTLSSCGAESVGGASVDMTSRYPTRTSYVRTMTALLDPVQIEERERKRLKQLEQQRAIEAQMEERRQQREQEIERKRLEEEEEERRLALEREMLQKQYKLDTLRERQKDQKKDPDDGKVQETLEPSAVFRQAECVQEKISSSVFRYKDTAVQTESAPALLLRSDRAQTPEVSAWFQPPPPPSLSAAPPNSRNRAVRTDKENICLSGGGGGGGDPYEAFARTERSKKDKKRPEWNTQRPSRRFVPASERYPAALQRNRQESRLKRQAELLALQERTRLPRTDPPPPLPQHQEPQLCSNHSQTRTSPRKEDRMAVRGNVISAAVNAARGRSPPVTAVRHSVQNQQAASSPRTSHVSEFIPYVRTDEVFNLDPLEPADTPPPRTHTAPSQRQHLLQPELLRNTHTHRQQEILRGLAQLRQGLLQKKRELETDLNPLIHHDNEIRSHSTTHHM